MSDRFFLDANIFVYSFDKNAPKKADRAAKLIRRAIEGQCAILYSADFQHGQRFGDLRIENPFL